MITVTGFLVCIVLTMILTCAAEGVFEKRTQARADIRAKIGRALESDDHKQIRATAVQYKPNIEKETFTLMIDRAESLEAGAVFAHENHGKLLSHVLDRKLLGKGRRRSGTGSVQNRVSCTSFLKER